MKKTKIETLRKKYESTQIDLVDLIRLFDPTKNRILTDLLMKEFLKQNGNKEFEVSPRIKAALHFDNPEDVKILKNNYLFYILMDVITGVFGEDTFYYLEQFNKYWVENKLPNRDVYSFSNLEDVKNMIHIVDLEEYTREQDVRVCKMYDDAEWMVVLPLSVKASQIYGAGTRWCTTEKNEHSFWQYTRNGLLFYIINKKHNIKFAYHRVIDGDKIGEPGTVRSEFFNSADMRVDSMDVSVPDIVLQAVKDFVKECAETYKHTNFDFAAYDRDGWERYNFGKTEENLTEEPDVRPAELVEERGDRPAPMVVVAHNANDEGEAPMDTPARGRVGEIMEVEQYPRKLVLTEPAPAPAAMLNGGNRGVIGRG